MHHAQTPAVHVQNFDLLTARVHNGIIVARGAQHGSELLKPVQHPWRGQISTVQNQVHCGEEASRFWSQLVQVPNEVGQMGIRENANAHASPILEKANPYPREPGAPALTPTSLCATVRRIVAQADSKSKE